MRLGIDASNLRAGGGVTHLREFLAAADPGEHGIGRVLVWGGARTLEQLPIRRWLELKHEVVLDKALPFRLAWQRRQLSAAVARECDVLFAPGGLCLSGFRPFYTMSRNLLPFEASERRRYGGSAMRVKLSLLRAGQTATFRRAEGVVFLTEYARRTVLAYTGRLPGATAVIPHGINPAFRRLPRSGRRIVRDNPAVPCRLLYVSVVDAYKHQWHVAEATARLRHRGWPVEMEFVGGSYAPALERLTRAIGRLDPAGAFLRYSGPVSYEALPDVYGAADVFVFASSCENMPNILLEGMASGLPIACASRGPMPEVLGDAGVYFDPEDPASIASAIETLLADETLRSRLAAAAHTRAETYSWARAARETLELISRTRAAAALGRAEGVTT